MKPISVERFNALAGYIRSPWTSLSARELAWYEAGDEKLLGVVSLDISDHDYVATVLARDAKKRFRAFALTINLETQDAAREWLDERLNELLAYPPEHFHQGDEQGAVVDFFAPVTDAARRHQHFEHLTTGDGYSPALGIIRELMHYFDDADGNFVEQFQTTAFDARLWELYLYALFTELGYGLDKTHPAPDFHCVGLLGDFFVEATTVNPSDEVPTVDLENENAYYDGYVPRKFGSALFSKIKKKYWELPHVSASPLVLAVQDFHAPGSMVWSNTGLVQYLYGIRQEVSTDANGKPTIVTERIEHHVWNGKELPSNFFAQPDSEHISAVIANPSGTLSKFNRMGFLAGFGRRPLGIVRGGFAYQGELWPTKFAAQVHEPDYRESWIQGLSVYHNPNAKIPLPETTFPGAAHHISRGNKIVAHIPTFFPLGSQDYIVVPTKDV
ncbi:MAG TPA: hypothetical protein VFS23_24635 [Vicinamibacterales bacterium]|jgi:hypothetical protein|nr:hypothetical protein [Vicinamibacterales bacterium]